MTMMISGVTYILGMLFLFTMQRAAIKNIWYKFSIASTMGIIESVGKILFGAGIANYMELGSIIIRKSTGSHILKQNLYFFLNSTSSFEQKISIYHTTMFEWSPAKQTVMYPSSQHLANVLYWQQFYTLNLYYY